jgi:hypothetical protein
VTMVPRGTSEREVVDEIERLMDQLKKARTVSEVRNVRRALVRRAEEYRRLQTQA